MFLFSTVYAILQENLLFTQYIKNNRIFHKFFQASVNKFSWTFVYENCMYSNANYGWNGILTSALLKIHHFQIFLAEPGCTLEFLCSLFVNICCKTYFNSEESWFYCSVLAAFFKQCVSRWRIIGDVSAANHFLFSTSRKLDYLIIIILETLQQYPTKLTRRNLVFEIPEPETREYNVKLVESSKRCRHARFVRFVWNSAPRVIRNSLLLVSRELEN